MKLDQARGFRHHRRCRDGGGNALARGYCCQRDYSADADRPVLGLGISAAMTPQRAPPRF